MSDEWSLHAAAEKWAKTAKVCQRRGIPYLDADLICAAMREAISQSLATIRYIPGTELEMLRQVRTLLEPMERVQEQLWLILDAYAQKLHVHQYRFCANCDQLILGTHQRWKYCGPRCRNTALKRAYRQRRRKQS